MPRLEIIDKAKLIHQKRISWVAFALVGQGTLHPHASAALKEQSADAWIPPASDAQTTEKLSDQNTFTIPAGSGLFDSTIENSHNIFEVTLAVAEQTASPTLTVRGLREAYQAIDLPSWYLPLDQVLDSLNITVGLLDSGELELRSPNSLTSLDPSEVVEDLELGHVISIKTIQTMLNVSVRFDASNNRLILDPPWQLSAEQNAEVTTSEDYTLDAFSSRTAQLEDPNTEEVHLAEGSASPPIFQESREAKEATQSHTIFPVGINIGPRNIEPSVFARGLTNDDGALALSQWQLPVNEVFEALNITVNLLDGGELELNSPGLITRIDPHLLTIDPEIGHVISVETIETVLGVPVEFDVIEYAVVLSPPWLNQPRSSPLQTDLPVIVEGLPTVASPRFSISAMRQRTTISGRGNNLEQITTQGDLSITGNALGGSWYVRTEQPEIGDRTTWRFSEAQYLQQTDSADYVIGSQPTFWPNQGSGSYWGATTIQRFGFEPMSPGHGGFSPQRRLQSDGIGRTIAGEATPGSVAQLVIGSSNIVVDEVLVDSSGVYRFEQVSTAKVRQFQVRLYPNGQLTAEPEIRRAEFLALPGQLTAGSSALLLSAGARQHSNGAFTGRFQDPTGGLAYRWGASEDLTLGIGAVYDESLLGFSELLYQPANAPLRVAISTLAGAQGLRYNANAYYNPSSRFDLTLSSDELSQRFRANWRVGPKFTMRASGNTRENALSIGASASINRRNFFLSGSGDLDTNGNLRWSLNSKWNRLRLSHRGNELTTNTELSYAFSRLPSAGLTAFLAYDTRQLNTTQSDFFQVGTRYRSYQRNQRGLNLWQFNLGYGVGSAGQGIQLAASTTAIPGLTMQARYQAISAFSDQPTFSVEISPTFNLQPALSLSDTTPETLRGRGSILVQPFFDTNNNGVKDESETVYTEDTDLLVLIDNQSAQRFSPNITSQGLIVHTEPGTHRLDLDPAGYPLDWKPTQRAYAVDVTAGGQTLVSLPLSQAYTLVGSVVNEQNEPISGATIEAVAQQGELPSASSVTNRAGVFLLEGLSQDAYQLLINGQPAQPGEIEFHIDSPTFQELNLLLSQTSRS